METHYFKTLPFLTHQMQVQIVYVAAGVSESTAVISSAHLHDHIVYQVKLLLNNH